MAEIRFSQNFVEEFEEIAKEIEGEGVKDLLIELKKEPSKLSNIDIDYTYVKKLKNFSHIVDDGYMYKFGKFRLVCLLEDQELSFISITTIDKIKEMIEGEEFE